MTETTGNLARINCIFTQKLNLETPGNDVDLFETGTLDSLTLVDLLAQLEAEFGFHLSPGQIDINEFRSLDSIAKFVNRHLSAAEEAVGTHQTAV